MIDQRAVRHRMEPFEHIRAGLGVRQQGLATQGGCGDLQVAARYVLEVEADQIHPPVHGKFKFRAQMRRAEKVGDLDNALRKLLLEGLQPPWRDDSLLSAVTQRLVKKRPIIKGRK